MLAQRLRHRIDIQALTYLEDSNGEPQRGEQGELLEKVWADVLPNEPAEVVPQSAREFNQSAAKQSETRGRMTIRKPDVPIDSTMRVVWQGVNYQIEGVLPDPSDRRWLTIIYSTGVNDGE